MRLRRRCARGKLKAGDIEEIQYPLPYDAAIVCVLTSSLTCLSSCQKVGLSFLLDALGYCPLASVATGMFMGCFFVSAFFISIDWMH